MDGTIRGVIFEIIIKKLLEKNDYENLQQNGQTIETGKIKGRGVWHQIDAFGKFSYTIPFIYPIRLIAEAKWFEGKRKKAGLDTVRNFVGVLKDISENYFIENGEKIDEKIFIKRYTDCGAVFSANGFSLDAQKYAYAQGIFLVSYENHYIMKDIITILKLILNYVNIEYAGRNKNRFSEWFYSQLSAPSKRKSDFVTNKQFFREINRLKGLFNKITSIMGIASGIYPVHFLSYQKIPEQIFINSDEHDCRIHFEEIENVLKIIPNDAPNVELFCSIPRELVLRYTSQMLKFKKKFFKYIDLPIKFGKIRRLLRLNLDERWLRKLEEEAQALNK